MIYKNPNIHELISILVDPINFFQGFYIVCFEDHHTKNTYMYIYLKKQADKKVNNASKVRTPKDRLIRPRMS